MLINSDDCDGRALQHFSERKLRLVALLGSGKHGTVILSERHQPNSRSVELVACKTLTSRAAFMTEVAALQQFQHPNIIRMQDHRVEDLSLLLEYIEGGTLADMLSHEPVAITKLPAIISGISAALSLIHASGWIHGDVSPGNIAIRADGSPVLLDFVTTRPANGLPIDEGNDLMIGDLRSAKPLLDIRALAATALAVIGGSHPPSSKSHPLANRLGSFIDRCDSGSAMSLDDLQLVVSCGRVESEQTGSSQSGRTRAFGPRPEPSPDNKSPTSRPTPRSRLFIGIALLLVLISTELHDSPVQPSPTTLQLTDEIAATETLRSVGATWNRSIGVLTVPARLIEPLNQSDGEVRLAVGINGDLAAIADWDCNGTSTLGVYRPATGEWFTFNGWDLATSSQEPTPIGHGPGLNVHFDATRCAVPEPY